MNFLNKYYSSVFFILKKYYLFIIIYYIIILYLIFISPFDSLKQRAILDASDELTLYSNSQLLNDVNITNIISLNMKYIFVSLLINISEFFASFLPLTDIAVFALLKSLFHLISTSFYFSIIYRYFNLLVAKISSLLYFFDPYLLGLKTSILRDDLIVSFSFIFISIYIKILISKFSFKNFFFFFSSYFILQFLRPLHSIALLLLVPLNELLYIYLTTFSIPRSIISKKVIFKYILFAFSVFIILFSLSGYYINYAFYLLDYFSISNFYIGIKNFFFSPLPSNVFKFLSGEYPSDINIAPYWFLFRFFFISIASIFIFIFTFYKRKNPLYFLSPLFLLSINMTFLYSIFSLGESSLGIRQGYFCYLLLIPVFVKMYLLLFHEKLS